VTSFAPRMQWDRLLGWHGIPTSRATAFVLAKALPRIPGPREDAEDQASQVVPTKLASSGGQASVRHAKQRPRQRIYIHRRLGSWDIMYLTAVRDRVAHCGLNVGQALACRLSGGGRPRPALQVRHADVNRCNDPERPRFQPFEAQMRVFDRFCSWGHRISPSCGSLDARLRPAAGNTEPYLEEPRDFSPIRRLVRLG
jgi:hypothetical protein